MSSILHYYRETEPPHSLLPSVKEQLKSLDLSTDANAITSIDTESCFNVQVTAPLSDIQKERLEWLLAETFDKDKLRLKSIFTTSDSENTCLLEFGPRMAFASAFSSNAVSICQACGLDSVSRLEKSRRFKFNLSSEDDKKKTLTPRAMSAIHNILHDRMTEEEYKESISSFDADIETEKVKTVPIMEEGRKALEKINSEKGLGFDDFDLDYYTQLFKVRYKGLEIESNQNGQD